MKFPRGNSEFASRIKSSEGFTLVESLIVMAIMAVLSAMLITGARSGTDLAALSTEQAVIVGTLNRAKSLTLARWDPNPDPNSPICGYGVYFDIPNGAFILYRDINLDAETTGVLCQNTNYTPRQNEEVETFTLDKRVAFDGSGTADILFLSPDLSALGGEIKLKMKNDASRTLTIQVTSGGAISTL